MKAPPVDVFIPTWNSSSTLPRVLEGLLIGGVPVKRLVVTDVHSSDGTQEILRCWSRARGIPILIVDNPPGLGSSRVIAEDLVETPIYVSLDSDVLLPPGWFDSLYRKIVADPGLVFVSSYVIFGDPGTMIEKICEFQRSQRYSQPCLGSTLIRKGSADFSVMNGQMIGEDTVFNRYMLRKGLRYLVCYDVRSYHPRDYRGDLAHLKGWGRGAREMGRHPIIEVLRTGRAILTAPRVAWRTRDLRILGYYPLRELYHLWGYATGSTRRDVSRMSFWEEILVTRYADRMSKYGK